MSILANLPHTCTAKTRTRTVTDDLGGTIDAFAVLFSDRRCWRQAANDREIREFDKRGISVTDKVYFTSDPGVDERHVLVFSDGSEFEVRSAAKPDASAGLGVVYRVMCEMTTTGSAG